MNINELIGLVFFAILCFMGLYGKNKKSKEELFEKNKLINLIETTINNSGFIIEEWDSLKTKCQNSDLKYTQTVGRQIYNLIKEEERKSKIKTKYINQLTDIEISLIIDGNYFLGMNQEMMLDSLGQPTKIEEEHLKSKHKVIFIYGNKSSGDVFTFENNKLAKVKDR